jgi:hypothetical protein
MARPETWIREIGMKRKLLIAAAGSVALMAPAAGAQDAGQYVRPYWWDKPVVEGLGRAIIEVAPNRARFDLAFVETDAKSDEAMKKALREMIGFITSRTNLSAADAYQFCSLAVDFHVTQTVNGEKGVHGMLKKGLLF